MKPPVRPQFSLPLLEILAAALVFFAAAAPGEAVELRYGGKLRVRGWELRNRSLVVRLTDEESQSLTGPIREEQNYFDMRARFYIEAAAGEDLQIVANSHFEIGDIVFGDKTRGTVGRSSGGGLGADGVNLETKNLYLDVNYKPWGASIRGGIFPVDIPIIFATDAAGVQMRLLKWGMDIEGDYIKAASNNRYDLDGNGLMDDKYYDFDIYSLQIKGRPLDGMEATFIYTFEDDASNIPKIEYGDDGNDITYYDTNQHWIGAEVNYSADRFLFHLTGLYNFGWIREVAAPHLRRDVNAFALDATIDLSLPWIGPQIFWHYASGDDPDTWDDEEFQDIMPEFERTSILFGGVGGYGVLDYSVSGTTAPGFSVNASLFQRMNAKFSYLHAWLTATPDVSDNFHYRGTGLSFGDEIDFELAYRPVDALKFMFMANVFIPGGGYQAHFDSPSGGPILEVMGGMQYEFRGRIPDFMGQ